MYFSDDLRKSSESKLLHFRTPGVRDAESPVQLKHDLKPDLDQVPHDIGVLRRPATVEKLGSPHLEEQDGLAHDARNLLTSLELFSGLLGEPGVLREEHKHYADDLKSLTAPLGAMVERLAAVSTLKNQAGGDPVFVREPLRSSRRAGTGANAAQLSSPRQDPQRNENDAGVMVKSCERLLAAIAGPAVALNISYERGLGELALSGESLTRVLINLVKNASEAMPHGGRVNITVRKGLGARPSALLVIEDKGNGIPAQALGQIFQAGFSSKKAGQHWPAVAHHGLGLTIVRDLVEGAGGSVRVASALTKGTTFEIKLPCRRG